MPVSILNNIPFNVDRERLIDSLRITERPKLRDEFLELVEAAEAIGKPKALFVDAEITQKGDDFVQFDSTRLTSRVLRVNLDEADLVFPALATCGTELEEWADIHTGLLQSFWAQSIKEEALSIAVIAVITALTEKHETGKTAHMTPGSLNDWPISEQRHLFRFFGDSAAEIGVSLTDSMLMRPLKSLSFLVFPSEHEFQSCQLCSREDCPNRRAPFEEGMLEHRYQITECETQLNH